jgi:hypothetical protein
MEASQREEHRLVRVQFLADCVAGGCIGQARDYQAGDVDSIPLSDARYLAAGSHLLGIRPKVLILSK